MCVVEMSADGHDRGFVSLVSAAATVRISKNGKKVQGTESPGMIVSDASSEFLKSDLWRHLVVRTICRHSLKSKVKG